MSHTSNPTASAVRFSRWVFRIAGTLGFFQIAPLYAYESTLNRTDPPAITHPEWYYGFVGVTLVWLALFVTAWMRLRDDES